MTYLISFYFKTTLNLNRKLLHVSIYRHMQTQTLQRPKRNTQIVDDDIDTITIPAPSSNNDNAMTDLAQAYNTLQNTTPEVPAQPQGQIAKENQAEFVNETKPEEPSNIPAEQINVTFFEKLKTFVSSKVEATPQKNNRSEYNISS